MPQQQQQQQPRGPSAAGTKSQQQAPSAAKPASAPKQQNPSTAAPTASSKSFASIATVSSKPISAPNVAAAPAPEPAAAAAAAQPTPASSSSSSSSWALKARTSAQPFIPQSAAAAPMQQQQQPQQQSQPQFLSEDELLRQTLGGEYTTVLQSTPSYTLETVAYLEKRYHQATHDPRFPVTPYKNISGNAAATVVVVKTDGPNAFLDAAQKFLQQQRA